MTLDDAIKVLNEREHQGYNDWIEIEEGLVEPQGVSVAGRGAYYLDEFEAIAIAKEYERIACRDYPDTRALLGFLRANQSLTEPLNWGELLENGDDLIRDAIKEWNDRP